MDDLITRIESADAGSRELDEAICKVLGIDLAYSGQASAYSGQPEYFPPCPYTTSIDAALSLLPAGWWWELNAEHATLGPPQSCDCCYSKLKRGEAATPALALCAAILKARNHDR